MLAAVTHACLLGWLAPQADAPRPTNSPLQANSIEELLAPRPPPQLLADYLGPGPFQQEFARRRLLRDTNTARTELRRQWKRTTGRDHALIVDLLACIAEDSDQDRFLQAANSDSALERAAAAEVLLPTLAVHSPVIDRLLRDPQPAVVSRLLRSLAGMGMPRRTSFANQHIEALGTRLQGRDPLLRRMALEALLLSDHADAANLIFDASEQFTPPELDDLMTRLVERPPSWPIAALESWLQRHCSPAHRQRAWCLRLQVRRQQQRAEPQPRMPTAALIDAILDGTRPEREAALTALAIEGPARGAELVQPSVQHAEHHGFGELLLLIMRLRGPEALPDLVRIYAQLPNDNSRGALLGQLHRLDSHQTTRAILEQILPRTSSSGLSGLVECVRLLPDGPNRRLILHRCLNRLEGAERVHAFQELCSSAQAQEFDALLSHLEATLHPASRQRMTQLLTQAYGPSEPSRMLDLLSELMDSPFVSDRVGALSAIPFVALGDRRDAIAEFLLRRFFDEAPQRLAMVLGHLGGPVAEAGLTRLLQSDSKPHRDIRPLTLHLAGAFSGPATAAALIDALDSPDDTERKEAFRSLIERRDPRILDRGPDLLLSLSAFERPPLIRELQACRHLEQMGSFLQKILPRLEEDDSRAALLELGASRHAEIIIEEVLAILSTKETSVYLRDAALQALGEMPSAYGGERLRALILPLRAALPHELVTMPEEPWILARAAALAHHMDHASERADELASVLIRGQTRRSFWDLRDWIQRGREQPSVGDAPLLTALGRFPAKAAVLAMEKALAEVAPLDLSLTESFFLNAADRLRTSDSSEDLRRWFENQPRLRWPQETTQDLASLVRSIREQHRWPSGDFRGLQPADLHDLPDLLKLVAHTELPPSIATTLFHRRDAFLGWNPRKTLAVASWLDSGEPDAQTFRADALCAAAREAGHHGLLLTALAELALEVELPLAGRLAEQAVQAAPYLPFALALSAWIQHLNGQAEARDSLRLQLQRVLGCGLAPDHPRRAVYEAAILVDGGRDASAMELLATTFRSHPELLPWIRGNHHLRRLSARWDHR